MNKLNDISAALTSRIKGTNPNVSIQRVGSMLAFFISTEVNGTTYKSPIYHLDQNSPSMAETVNKAIAEFNKVIDGIK